jgi:hypothetical protein
MIFITLTSNPSTLNVVFNAVTTDQIIKNRNDNNNLISRRIFRGII